MIATVTTPYQCAYPNPIQFQRGESLLVGQRDEEFPGWIWVTTATGNAGWAPEAYLTCHSPLQGEANLDYSARELSVVVGQKVHLHHDHLGWSWVETQCGEQGWVPSSHLNTGATP